MVKAASLEVAQDGLLGQINDGKWDLKSLF